MWVDSPRRVQPASYFAFASLLSSSLPLADGPMIQWFQWLQWLQSLQYLISRQKKNKDEGNCRPVESTCPRLLVQQLYRTRLEPLRCTERGREKKNQHEETLKKKGGNKNKWEADQEMSESSATRRVHNSLLSLSISFYLSVFLSFYLSIFSRIRL